MKIYFNWYLSTSEKLKIEFHLGKTGTESKLQLQHRPKYSNGSIVTSVVSMSWGGSENYFVELPTTGTSRLILRVTLGYVRRIDGRRRRTGHLSCFVGKCLGHWRHHTGYQGLERHLQHRVGMEWQRRRRKRLHIRPSYQNAVQTNSHREIPDVSFDADPEFGRLGLRFMEWGERGGAGGTSAAPVFPPPAGPA